MWESVSAYIYPVWWENTLGYHKTSLVFAFCVLVCFRVNHKLYGIIINSVHVWKNYIYGLCNLYSIHNQLTSYTVWVVIDDDNLVMKYLCWIILVAIRCQFNTIQMMRVTIIYITFHGSQTITQYNQKWKHIAWQYARNVFDFHKTVMVVWPQI